MGTCDLPEIYTLTLGLHPRARVYISGKSLVPMLQLLHISSGVGDLSLFQCLFQCLLHISSGVGDLSLFQCLLIIF